MWEEIIQSFKEKMINLVHVQEVALALPFKVVGRENKATFEHLKASSLSYRIVLQLQERKCNFPAI